VKHRIAFINLPLLAVFLVLASTAALASNTWYVDGVHGKNKNDCKSPQTACKTIGHAISLASSGDSIRVAAATYTENLTIGLSLKVIGSGAVTTIIDGGGNGTVFTISNTSAHVALSMVTIRNGFVIGSQARGGGGINNSGTLTIANSTVRGNIVRGTLARGGGIFNSGTLTIANSTVSTNSARGVALAVGGGVSNEGSLTINNSTISGNTASAGGGSGAHGGGVSNGWPLTMNNSTLSLNFARGVRTTWGGIDNGSTATLQNSIVANNSQGKTVTVR
jgi:hypothetical protein